MGKIRIGKAINHGFDVVGSNLGKYLPVVLAIVLSVWAVNFAGQAIVDSTTDLPSFAETWERATKGESPDTGSRSDLTIQGVVSAVTIFFAAILNFMLLAALLRSLRNPDGEFEASTLRDPAVLGAAVTFAGAFVALFLVMQILPLYAGAIGGLLALAAVVAMVYFGIAWSQTSAAAAYDGRTGVTALKRSAELLGGNWWRMLGLVIVAGLIVIAGYLAMLIVVGLIPFVGLDDPFGGLLLAVPVGVFSAIFSAGVLQSVYTDVAGAATVAPTFPVAGDAGLASTDGSTDLPPAQDPPPPGVV